MNQKESGERYMGGSGGFKRKGETVNCNLKNRQIKFKKKVNTVKHRTPLHHKYFFLHLNLNSFIYSKIIKRYKIPNTFISSIENGNKTQEYLDL